MEDAGEGNYCHDVQILINSLSRSLQTNFSRADVTILALASLLSLLSVRLMNQNRPVRQESLSALMASLADRRGEGKLSSLISSLHMSLLVSSLTVQLLGL